MIVLLHIEQKKKFATLTSINHFNSIFFLKLKSAVIHSIPIYRIFSHLNPNLVTFIVVHVLFFMKNFCCYTYIICF